MANPNPKVDHLKAAPGAKPKGDTQPYTIRLSESAKSKIEDIAASLDCVYNGVGSLSRLLSAIASEELVVVPKPSYIELALSNHEKNIYQEDQIIDQIIDEKLDLNDHTFEDQDFEVLSEFNDKAQKIEN